jgi:hypothetical protein
MLVETLTGAVLLVTQGVCVSRAAGDAAYVGDPVAFVERTSSPPTITFTKSDR